MNTSTLTMFNNDRGSILANDLDTLLLQTNFPQG
jgi:hypothetical protein